MTTRRLRLLTSPGGLSKGSAGSHDLSGGGLGDKGQLFRPRSNSAQGRQDGSGAHSAHSGEDLSRGSAEDKAADPLKSCVPGVRSAE